MSIQPTEPIGALEQDEPIMTAPSAESEECASSREAHVSRCRRLRVPRMKCLRLPWTPLLFGMQLLRTSFLKNFLCKAHYVTTSAVPDEGEDEEATEAPLHIAAAGFSASGSSSPRNEWPPQGMCALWHAAPCRANGLPPLWEQHN